MDPQSLKVYTPEEIEMFLSGDRREVDRLLIHGINNIATVLIPHMAKEEEIFHVLGDSDVIRSRSIWIDAQILKQEKRNKMMDKVTESTVIWALPVFALMIFLWFGDTILDAVRQHLTKIK
jgi:hypothetical protein